MRHPKVEQVAFSANALAVDDVKLNFLEGRRQFVFGNFGFGATADDFFAVLDGSRAADINPY